MSVRNSQGESVDKDLTKVPDIPNAPTSVSGTDVGTGRAFANGAATVTVTPDTSYWGSTITNYTVTASPGGATATGSSPVTVTGLSGNSSYTFTATSNAPQGNSPSSSASTSVPITTVPDVPTSVTATNQPSTRPYNSGQASVAFTAGNNGGKTVSTYTVTPSPATSPTTFTGSSSPIVVTGLASATAYTYTVTATNANGTGSASSASSAVTATTVPDAPTIGAVTDSQTGGTVTVGFTAGATGGSSITGYTATSSPGSITGTGASSPITVSGLTNNTAYTFTVTATNANGTSTASSASSSVTPTNPVFESIATATPNAVNTITFSSIPSTYKSLQLRIVGVGNNDWAQMVLNGDTGANYTFHEIMGQSTTVSAANLTSFNNMYRIVYLGGASATPGIAILDIIDYASTSKYKTIKNMNGANGASANFMKLDSYLWMNSTSAVSSITISSGTNFATGASFALYGIKG